MNDFKKNALSWGEDGAKWLKKIPDLIATYEKKWDIKVSPPFDLNYNYVAPALRKDGSMAVLKIGFPKDTEFQSEIEALKIFNGNVMCSLLESDQTNATILIERVAPGDPVSSIDDDDEATRIIARLATKLHKPLPADHSFSTPQDLATALTDYLNRYQDSGPLPSGLVKKAANLFDYLISSSSTPVLVHGDLHHFNVLSSEEHGWRAIDPKGIAAEPAYDVGAMIRNPYEDLKHINDLKPLVARRIAILAEELEVDSQRITQWCFAQTVLSAVWSTEGVKGPSHALRAAEAINSLL